MIESKIYSLYLFYKIYFFVFAACFSLQYKQPKQFYINQKIIQGKSSMTTSNICFKLPRNIKRSKKTRWSEHELQIEPERLRMMHERSVLVPPPSNFIKRQKNYYNTTISGYKNRLEQIFRRIQKENYQNLKNNKSKFYLSQKEFKQFLQSYRNQSKDQFRTLCKTSKSFMKDGLYDGMEYVLRQTQQWLRNLQQQIKTKYRKKIETYEKIKNIKERYYADKLEDAQSKIYYYNQDDQSQQVFNMRQMETQITNLLMKEQISIFKATDLNRMYKKNDRYVNNDERKNESDSQSSEVQSSSDQDERRD